MLTHLYDDHSAWTQRKNAANKLQHSGAATLVVCHIRHRVVHHIDMRAIYRGRGRRQTAKTRAEAFASTLERGPDFAEQGRVHPLGTGAWDMGHTALC